MISRKFVELWAPRFDAHKFPPDFYRRHLISARNTEQSQQFKEDLLALLHWKDGKAGQFVPGEDHAKPNTLGPILMLAGDSLTDFKKIFDDLAQSKDNLTETCAELREKLTSMWNTVVMPAFLLHVARPDRLPIIDQHTVRAFLALTRGEVQVTPKITWKLWCCYVAFFQNAVAAAGYNHNWEEHCYVDHALFAWGKTLKGAAKLRPDAQSPKSPKPRTREGDPGMKTLSTWGGKSSFSYDGSVENGTKIYYGQKSHINVTKEQYVSLLDCFRGITADAGTSRTGPPQTSVGAWLRRHATKTAIASYILPILIDEGYGKKAGDSQICFKQR